MLRYHKKVSFPVEHKQELKNFVSKINSIDFIYTKHCIDRLYQNELSDEKVSLALKFIKNLTFDYVNIFEYYYEPYMQAENIRKIVLRLAYKEHTDIIIVIGNNKELITIYTNSKNDNHVTLKKEIYVKN